MAAASNHIVRLLILCLLIALSGVLLTRADLPRFAHPSKDDGSLSLLVLGDWGRNGDYNQSEVALQVLPLSYTPPLFTLSFHFHSSFIAYTLYLIFYIKIFYS
uniref:Uncharacterized protein n=1 Tax=Cucumis melo TaxID=3656 RepID=A0A9I9CL39_CUCME